MYSTKKKSAPDLRRAATLLVVLLALSAADPARAAWKAGDKLPPLAGRQLEGALPALDRQVVLLDFWASWCGPCKRSFPELDKIQQAYRARGFTVLAVSVDEKAGDMQKFLAAHAVSFPVVRDAGQKLVAAAGVESMPTSLLVDRRGLIRFVHVGFRGEETVKQLHAEIEQLLNKK